MNSLQLTIIISAIAVLSVTGLVTYQTHKINKQEQRIEELIVRNKEAIAKEKAKSFTETQTNIIKIKKEAIHETNLSKLPDGNYTISF